MMKSITKIAACIGAIAGALYQVDRLATSGAVARFIARIAGVPWAAGVGIAGAWFDAVLALVMLLVVAGLLTAIAVHTYSEARLAGMALWALGLGSGWLLIATRSGLTDPLTNPRVSGIYDARWLVVGVIGSALVLAPLRRARLLRVARAHHAELERWRAERVRQENAGLRPRLVTEPTAEERAEMEAERERRQAVAALMRAYNLNAKLGRA